jgi:putative transposase
LFLTELQHQPNLVPMPRTARVVVPGLPHHVIQRGNRRMTTFFADDDYRRYRTLLAEGCRNAGVEVIAYCLMPNHVHLVLVPSSPTGLRDAVAIAHRKYAAAINRRQGWRGHLWQERFHSYPLLEDHFVAAVRYVELNPVRAHLVASAWDWRWSSAGARLAARADELVTADLPPGFEHVGAWVDFLNAGNAATVAGLRHRAGAAGQNRGQLPISTAPRQPFDDVGSGNRQLSPASRLPARLAINVRGA